MLRASTSGTGSAGPWPTRHGIVVAEPEGRQTRYEIADPHLAAALTALVDVTLAVDESAPCIDPACTVPGRSAASSSGDAT